MVSLLQNNLPIPVESVTFIKDSDKVLYSDLPARYTADSGDSEFGSGHQSIQNIKKNIALYRKDNMNIKAGKKQKEPETSKKPPGLSE